MYIFLVIFSVSRFDILVSNFRKSRYFSKLINIYLIFSGFRNKLNTYCWVSDILKEIKYLFLAVQSAPTFTAVRFYDATRPIFIFAQIFAVMPVDGLFSRNVNRLNFRWTSLHAIHTGIVCFGLVIFSGFSLFHVFSKKLTIQNSSPIVFYLSNLYSMFSFMFVARKWPYVMQYWSNVETTLPKVKTRKEMNRMSKKIQITAGVILFASIVEHLLSVTKGISFSRNCSKIANGVEAFYRKSAPQIFNHIEFNTARACVCSFFLITSTFLWNYMDVFIIVISLGLSSKFRQMNQILFEQKRKVTMYSTEARFNVIYDLITLIFRKFPLSSG